MDVIAVVFKMDVFKMDYCFKKKKEKLMLFRPLYVRHDTIATPKTRTFVKRFQNQMAYEAGNKIQIEMIPQYAQHA